MHGGCQSNVFNLFPGPTGCCGEVGAEEADTPHMAAGFLIPRFQGRQQTDDGFFLGFANEAGLHAHDFFQPLAVLPQGSFQPDRTFSYRQACAQFIWLKRLDNIIVRTEVQALDAVAFFEQGGLYADTDGAPPIDEDGVLSPLDLWGTVGTQPAVTLLATNTTGTTATLSGWIDYNADGVFDNASERAQIAVPDGTTLVTTMPPSSTS